MTIPRKHLRRHASALLLSILAYSAGASAQNDTGFAVNRFDPAERGSDWFWAESLDLRGHNRWAIGAVGDWAFKPLVAYDRNGDEVAALIEHQIYTHLGASVVFWDRLRLGANLPLLIYQTGDSVTVGGAAYQAPRGAALGDLRLGADFRLFGEYGSAATLAVGVQVHIPTGSQSSYTSDGSARIVPKITFAGDKGIFTYALKSGINVRLLEQDFASLPLGSEWFFGGAVGVRLLDKKLIVGPEAWASTVLNDPSRGFFQGGTTPVEAILGAHYRFAPDWKIGLGVGPGFTRGIGSPTLRTLLSIEWAPEPEQNVAAALDRDHDGITDELDACPDVAGVPSDDPTKNGCPAALDRDHDGITDELDACPDVAGVPSDDPTKNGCPESQDRDKDGILDADDACPTEPGVASSDPLKNGCSEPKDTDKDTILDPVDACPERAGPPNTDPKKHGCPKATVQGTKVNILDRIEFDTGKATIRPESNSVLEAVLAVLKEHQELEKIRVEGHTDNKGAVWRNKNLSKDRAAAVVKWLVGQGIAESRLESAGIGQDDPIDNNETEDGRQNNRRVEFEIIKTAVSHDEVQK